MAAPAPASGTVPVRAPDGSIGQVAKGDLAQALEAGSEVVSSEEFHAAAQKVQDEEKYGGIGGAAAAAGLGVARGATLGLSDAAAADLGGPSVREALRGYQEANPYASMGGEVAGVLAPALLSGGAGAVGTAARVAGAPVRAAGAIGRLAEGAAARIVGEGGGMLARAGRAAVTTAAGFGAEGAVYGAGAGLSEASLSGDHDQIAQRVLAGARDGALMGIGLGAGAGAAGALLKGAFRPIAELGERSLGGLRGNIEAAQAASVDGAAVAEQRSARATFAEARAHGGETYIKLAAGGDPQREAILREAWGRRHELIATGEDRLEGATRKLSSAVDDQLKAGRDVDIATFGESKKAQMGRLVPKDAEKPAIESSLRIWQDAKDTVAGLDALSAKGGAEGSVKKIGKWLEDFGRDMGKKSPGDLFNKLDDFKRSVDREARFGTSPFGRTEAAREFENLGNRIRAALEDERTWGPAAVAQKEINATTSAMIDKGSRFTGQFAKQYGSTLGMPDHVADPAAVNSFLRNLTSAKNDLNQQMFTDRIAGRRRFLDSVEKNYELDPKARQAVAKERSALERAEKTIGETTKDVETINLLRAEQAKEAGRGIGGLAGLALDVTTRPITTMARLASLEQSSSRVAARVSSSVSQFIRGEFKSFRGVARAARSASGASRPAIAMAERQRSSREEYNHVRDAVAAAAANPAATQARIAKHIDTLSSAAPNVATAVGMTSMRAVNYLAAIAPARFMDAASLTPFAKRPEPKHLSVDETRFMRAARAVRDPLSVLDDMHDGAVSRDSVLAIKTVYPALYADIVRSVYSSVATRKDKDPMPMAQATQLGLLLDTPTHYTMTPEFIEAVQATKAAPPANDTGGGPSQARGHNPESNPEHFVTPSEDIQQ